MKLNLFPKTVVLDKLDILLLSLMSGSILSIVQKKFFPYKGSSDPIIEELKNSVKYSLKPSPMVEAIDLSGAPLKAVLIRGGQEPVGGVSLTLRNELITRFIKRIREIYRKNQKWKYLAKLFFLMHAALFRVTGYQMGLAGDLTGIQVIVVATGGTLSGYLFDHVSKSFIPSVLIPAIGFIIVNRDFLNSPETVDSVCKLLCKAVEDYSNEKFKVELREFSKLHEIAQRFGLEDTLQDLQCVGVTSGTGTDISTRWAMKQLLESEKTKQRIKLFSDLTRNLEDCGPDEVAYAIDKVKEKIRIIG